MSFAQPLWLWAILVLPAILAAFVVARRRDQERTARLVARPLWGRVLVRPRPLWRFVRLAGLLVGALGLVLALARPQWGIVREKVEREGVDVVLVLDTSSSMGTEDVPGSRFFLGKTSLLSLLSRLEGDRFALVAFEGDAYPLVPLTLDADAVGLFLDSIEPGAVSSPGTSLGSGLARGLELFIDDSRRNKAMVLVSDGENLEGDVDAAVKRAREKGVIVHTVGVGTENGGPVPEVDRRGERVGFKKDEGGAPVVSRFHPETLEAIARGTNGRFVRLTAADTTLAPVAAAIEGMEQKTLAREFSYRKKERFQIPLGLGLGALAVAFLFPLPRNPRAARAVARAAVITGIVLVGPSGVHAQDGPLVDEVLLRPRRLTNEGRRAYGQGNLPEALKAFEAAAQARPQDPRARFNLADALYKNGRYDEAETAYRALAADPRSPLAPAARFNLGNTLYQKQDFRGAAAAYRDALRLTPADPDAKRNLELALQALERQEEQQRREQQRKQQDESQDREGAQKDKPDERKDPRKDESARPPSPPPGQPADEQAKEEERFEREAGMPRERAMQLLDALQQTEKGEQKKLLAGQKKPKKNARDW